VRNKTRYLVVIQNISARLNDAWLVHAAAASSYSTLGSVAAQLTTDKEAQWRSISISSSF
jgi:hypothetical protein